MVVPGEERENCRELSLDLVLLRSPKAECGGRGTLCTMGLLNRALKGVESKGFDFDFPVKIHFLLIMTGWCVLEMTTSLVPGPLSLVPTEEVFH